MSAILADAAAAAPKIRDASQGASPNWERIEADYRAGLLSLRAIAAKDGHVTEAAVRKRAKKLEWARDLTARVHARAEELVRTELVRRPGAQYATASEPAETAIVESSAQLLAAVELTHRREISRARAAVVSLFSELEAFTDERITGVLSRELLATIDADEEAVANRARGALRKAISLPARASAVKSLADAMRTLVALERESWGLGTVDTGNQGSPPPVIDSRSLTPHERLELRRMMLKAVAHEQGPAIPAQFSSEIRL